MKTSIVIVSIASVCAVAMLAGMIHAGDWTTLEVIGAVGVVAGIGWAWQLALAA